VFLCEEQGRAKTAYRKGESEEDFDYYHYGLFFYSVPFDEMKYD